MKLWLCLRTLETKTFGNGQRRFVADNSRERLDRKTLEQVAYERSGPWNMTVATGQSFGWAVRKDSPNCWRRPTTFLKLKRQGAAFGKELMTRYTGSTYMLKQAVSETAMKQFEKTAATFRKYGTKYDTDYLLMMAKGYQESGLNQEAKSPVGAIGIMQLMPATGAEMNVGDIHQARPEYPCRCEIFLQDDEATLR